MQKKCRYSPPLLLGCCMMRKWIMQCQANQKIFQQSAFSILCNTDKYMGTYFDHLQVALKKKGKIKIRSTFPYFLKKGHLKMVKIGFSLFSVLHRKLGSDSITRWKLIAENWTQSALTHTALFLLMEIIQSQHFLT